MLDRNINERGKIHTQQISVKILQILLGKTISLPKELVYVLKIPDCLEKNFGMLLKYAKKIKRKKKKKKKKKKKQKKKKKRWWKK